MIHACTRRLRRRAMVMALVALAAVLALEISSPSVHAASNPTPKVVVKCPPGYGPIPNPRDPKQRIRCGRKVG
jgi:hypothetical protein